MVAFALGVIVGMALLVFAIENKDPVRLGYFFTWQSQGIPLSLLILVAVWVGFALAALSSLMTYLRQRRTIREQQRTIAELRAGLCTLRTLPLHTSQGSASAPDSNAKPPPPTVELSSR
ncbi:MAG: LapA family protein [Nitrospinae bacterium]|nr:LapA family protein [Nitrospinota bacterium]